MLKFEQCILTFSTLEATAVARGKHICVYCRRLRSPNVTLFQPTQGDSGRPRTPLPNRRIFRLPYGLHTVFLHTADMGR